MRGPGGVIRGTGFWFEGRWLGLGGNGMGRIVIRKCATYKLPSCCFYRIWSCCLVAVCSCI